MTLPDITGIYGVLIAGALGLLVGFGGGWHVKDWKDTAAQGKQSAADLTAYAKQTAATEAQNQKTAQGLSDLLATMQAQDHAFANVNTFLATHAVGSCSLNAAADQLYLDAYKAAFPEQANQAARRHATDRESSKPPNPVVGVHR